MINLLPMNLDKMTNSQSVGQKSVGTFGVLPFKGSQIKDTISFQGANTKQWADNVSQETRQEILKLLENTNFEDLKPLGVGADGTAYILGGVPGYPKGVVAKVSHTQSKNPITGEAQRTNMTYENERKVLKKLGNVNPDSQSLIGYLEMKNGANILLTTLVEGKSPNVKTNPLNKKDLKNILIALGNLDSRNILHRDLKKENLHTTSDNRAGLIDFGEAIAFKDEELEKNTGENHFAPFEAVSNTKNFESTFLTPYINELAQQDPKAAKELFREYLTLKAEYIHKPAAQRLTELVKSESMLDRDEKLKVIDIVQYQQFMEKMLTNPTETVLNAEMLKAQIPYNSELAYKNEILLLNPLANVTMKFNSLLAAKKLENLAAEGQKGIKSTDTKTYLEYQEKYAKFHLEKVSSWTEGLVGWLLSCFKTPIKEANEYQKPVIEQFLKDDLNGFEIPDLPSTIKGEK